MTLLIVAIGGALGALARYLSDRLIAALIGRDFPWGTLVVNVVGSFLLGVVLVHTDGRLALFLGTGGCGALTTYSTFASESVALLEGRQPGRALANIVLNLTLGVVGVVLGLATG